MAERYQRPYPDANCWITALTGDGPFQSDIAELFIAADRADLVIVMSALMPLEVLGGNGTTRTDESAEAAMRAMSRSTVVQVAATRRVVAEARELRIRHGLKSMDAVHLASAAAGRADVFLSNDDQVVALGSHRGVPILRPEWPGDLPLDFGS